jgi:CubicO group peptidase (beta-lactamase class C family)
MNGISYLSAVRLGALLFMWALAFSAPTWAETPAALDLKFDAAVADAMKNQGFMGAVLVANGDRVLFSRGYGEANLEWSIPNSPDTEFRLGSLTKQFTAALVLKLQEGGKLKINDKISTYLPDAPKAWANITVAELLGHTSGIPNFTDDPTFGVWSASPHTPAELLAFFKDKPLDFPPGTKFAYSNSNYAVLGVLIEKLGDGAYGEQLKSRLFDPLGMTHTGLDSDDLILPKRASGYRPRAGALVYARSESMTVPWAAGGLYATTGDLLRWERALFGTKVISADSLKRMTTPGLGHYGLGLFSEKIDGKTVISHGGGIEGFNTELYYAPETDVTVVVLSNVNTNQTGPLARKLLAIAISTAPAPP